MSEQQRHLVNKCKDIINLQGAEALCVATRTACFILRCAVLYCVCVFLVCAAAFDA